ncbi:MAG: DUF58 domain-containing protein [Haloarculaceae archaeon]
MITPAFLDELDRVAASQRRQVDSRFQGEHESDRRGEGLTFADYRRYSPGDDTRLIDWRLYARTEELYVKQFEEERDLTVHVLVDGSGSMDFGDEGGTHKFEYAAKLGLGFAYLAARDHNDFRLALLGEGLERLDRGRSNRGEVLALVDALNDHEPTGTVDFRRALADYEGTIGSRSLVLVASDFLAAPDDVGAGLDALAGNHLALAHVLAPGEREVPAAGDTVFEGLEAESSLRTYFGARLADRYRDRLDAHVDAVAERARDVGARHDLVDTGTDFFDAFLDVWDG